jgi:anaerobic selenocysteine-containing dehydrogenase
MTQIIRTVCAHDCPDMCSLLVHVEEGRVVRVQGDPEQPFTSGFVCGKVSREPELVHSPDRLTTPLRRTGPKGTGSFMPVSWAEALDEIVERWQSVIVESGPAALLGYCYSAHQGQFNRGLPLALFDALGATKLIAGTVCDTCADEAWASTVGPVGGADPEMIDQCDLIIAWGADLVTTNVHFWAKIQQARRNGATIITIDPYRSRTAAQSDWHVQPRIGSDAALALGIMHVIARDGLVDADFIRDKTLGFDRLRSEVLPRCSPESIARRTGVPAIDIERLAHLFSKARAPFIRLGQGMSRHVNGGLAIRAVSVLPGLVGAYGRPSAGALLSTTADFDFDYSVVREPSGMLAPRLVNHSRLGQALLELDDPPIRALFVAGNNPAVTCPDAGAVRRGLAREDLFTVVHDPFLSDTARFADIVLPATTYLETDDFYRSYGTYRMQYGPAAIEPVGEAWSNRRLARELAMRMRVTLSLFEMDTEALIAMLTRKSKAAEGFDTESMLSGRSLKLERTGSQQFKTPSGKLELYPSRPSAAPDWLNALAETVRPPEWPLQLLTAPGYFQSHGAFAGNRTLRQRQGPPVCILHPDEAAKRGLQKGSRVELVNRHGKVTLELNVDDAAPIGVVLVPGQLPEAAPGDGVINVLCSSEYSDMGEGATYQSTFVEVRSEASPEAVSP